MSEKIGEKSLLKRCEATIRAQAEPEKKCFISEEKQSIISKLRNRKLINSVLKKEQKLIFIFIVVTFAFQDIKKSPVITGDFESFIIN